MGHSGAYGLTRHLAGFPKSLFNFNNVSQICTSIFFGQDLPCVLPSIRLGNEELLFPLTVKMYDSQSFLLVPLPDPQLVLKFCWGVVVLYRLSEVFHGKHHMNISFPLLIVEGIEFRDSNFFLSGFRYFEERRDGKNEQEKGEREKKLGAQREGLPGYNLEDPGDEAHSDGAENDEQLI